MNEKISSFYDLFYIPDVKSYTIKIVLPNLGCTFADSLRESVKYNT